MRELRLIDPPCAAMRLSLPVRRLMTLVRSGSVPFVELPGGDVRFDPMELAEWVDGLKPATPEDPAITATGK